MRSFLSGVVEESVSRQESVRRRGGGGDKHEFMHIPYLIWNIWDRFGFRPGYLLCSCFLCGVRWFTLCCFHADKIQNPEIQFPKPSFAIPVPSWSAPSLDLEHSPKPNFAIPVPCGVIWVGKVTMVFLLSSLCVFFQFQIQFYFG